MMTMTEDAFNALLAVLEQIAEALEGIDQHLSEIIEFNDGAGTGCVRVIQGED
jgi:hypothetical protein